MRTFNDFMKAQNEGWFGSAKKKQQVAPENPYAMYNKMRQADREPDPSNKFTATNRGGTQMFHEPPGSAKVPARITKLDRGITKKIN